MVAQAGPLGKALAGGQAKGLTNQLIDEVPLPGGDKGAEEGATGASPARYPQPGEVLVGQLYAGIARGVLELDVLAGLVLLDKGVL